MRRLDCAVENPRLVGEQAVAVWKHLRLATGATVLLERLAGAAR